MRLVPLSGSPPILIVSTTSFFLSAPLHRVSLSLARGFSCRFLFLSRCTLSLRPSFLSLSHYSRRRFWQTKRVLFSTSSIAPSGPRTNSRDSQRGGHTVPYSVCIRMYWSSILRTYSGEATTVQHMLRIKVL